MNFFAHFSCTANFDSQSPVFFLCMDLEPNGLESVIQAEPADVYETPRPENIAREMPPLGNPRNPHNSSVQNASRQAHVGTPPTPTPQDKVGRPDIKCHGCMSAGKGLADSSGAFHPNPEKLAIP